MRIEPTYPATRINREGIPSKQSPMTRPVKRTDEKGETEIFPGGVIQAARIAFADPATIRSWIRDEKYHYGFKYEYMEGKQ